MKIGGADLSLVTMIGADVKVGGSTGLMLEIKIGAEVGA